MEKPPPTSPNQRDQVIRSMKQTQRAVIFLSYCYVLIEVFLFFQAKRSYLMLKFWLRSS